MSLLARKRDEPPPAEKSSADQVHAAIERLAVEAEPDALSKRDALLVAANAEHAAQVAGFKFECVRLGSFLTIKTTRKANPEERPLSWLWYGDLTREFSTALNLARVGRINLTRGHAPDLLGTVTYAASLESDDGSSQIGGDSSMPVPKGYRRVVRPQLPSVPDARPHFWEEPEPVSIGDGSYFSGESYKIRFQTPNFTRVAEDDKIEFRGLRSTLYVPAGLGEEVYQRILAAT